MSQPPPLPRHNPEELFWTMDAKNSDDLSDAIWWKVLEDTVVMWNETYGTKHDPSEMVVSYVDWKEKRMNK